MKQPDPLIVIWVMCLIGTLIWFVVMCGVAVHFIAKFW